MILVTASNQFNGIVCNFGFYLGARRLDYLLTFPEQKFFS